MEHIVDFVVCSTFKVFNINNEKFILQQHLHKQLLYSSETKDNLIHKNLFIVNDNLTLS